MNINQLERRRREPTAYQLFVREQAAMRPTTTNPQEWMREVGRRWRNRGQPTLVNNDDNALTGNKECVICYNDKPLTLYSDGPCQHHHEICRDCCLRVNQCPYCRTIWRRPQQPPVQLQPQQPIGLPRPANTPNHLRRILLRIDRTVNSLDLLRAEVEQLL